MYFCVSFCLKVFIWICMTHTVISLNFNVEISRVRCKVCPWQRVTLSVCTIDEVDKNTVYSISSRYNPLCGVHHDVISLV